MFPRLDSCALTIRYPSLSQELDACLPQDQIPAHHRWISPESSWDELLTLHAMVAPEIRTRAVELSPAETVADLVEYGLNPAVETARREFPEELDDFCGRVWKEAFDGAPSQRMRLICLDFAGPLWACASTVSMASKQAVLVALRVAGRYKAVASRAPQVQPGADLQIDWTGPSVRDFRPF
jgi:hypothetical protein